MPDGQLILVAGALLAAALAASLLAGRIRVPGLVLFLGLGMAIGSDGTGWIHFSDYGRARTIGVVALALILFEGGLTAGFREIKPVLPTAISLALVGTLVTAVITGLAAAWLFDLSTLEGLLLGSIVASTDGAAIFALLRGSTLRRKLARTLEGEAGPQRPDRGAARGGLHRLDPEARLRRGRHARAVRAADRDRGGGGPRRGVAGGAGAAADQPRHRGPLPGRHDRHRGARVRRRRRAARLRLPGGVPGGADAGQRPDPGEEHRHHLPPGARLGRAAHDVHGARAARVPQPARPGGARGDGAGARAGVRRPAGGDGARDDRRPLRLAASGSCSAGPACAAPCRWCSRRSR